MPSRSTLRAANPISPREALTGSLPSWHALPSPSFVNPINSSTAEYLANYDDQQLAYYVLSFRPRHGEKIFHYLFTIALLVGAISYFAMASGLAYSVIPTELHTRDAATYQIFFAKYIFWVVAFPVIIIALGLVSGVSWATIFFNIFLAWIWYVKLL
jgi:bacteriorhodopsin